MSEQNGQTNRARGGYWMNKDMKCLHLQTWQVVHVLMSGPVRYSAVLRHVQVHVHDIVHVHWSWIMTVCPGAILTQLFLDAEAPALHCLQAFRIRVLYCQPTVFWHYHCHCTGTLNIQLRLQYLSWMPMRHFVSILTQSHHIMSNVRCRWLSVCVFAQGTSDNHTGTRTCG